MAKGRKLKIFSFFAGCGILDLGFEKAGYDIEFVNEFFKPFQDAYIWVAQISRQRVSMPYMDSQARSFSFTIG
jgi:hypothetical protein